jgi:glyoxylase I family protein
MRRDLEADLLPLESALLDPEVRGSPERVDALLAEDFVEFASSGVAYDKARILELLRDEALADDPVLRSLAHFEAVELAEGVALTRYRLLRRASPHEAPTQSLRSSLWRRNDGRWQMVFHQGTYVIPSGEEAGK